MDLLLVGLSHKTAPIDIRERLAIREDTVPQVLRELSRSLGFREAMILSTCNRVEVMAGPTLGDDSLTQLNDYLSRHHGLAPESLRSHLYSFTREDLVNHVFHVAASLDSMVVGEAQILGQLKSAFSHSQEAGLAGVWLQRLMPHAFFVAKRVRSETHIGESSVSISSVAVELAVKIFGDLGGRSVLLLGTGKMGELAIRSLIAAGVGQIQVANRTREKAEVVAARFKGTAVPFERLEDALVASDIVLVSTGADQYLLTRSLVEKAVRRRRYDPVFIVDISVPRNVDPAVNSIETAFVYDIDDLQSVVDSHLQERNQEAEIAEQIVREEVRNFVQMMDRRNVGPLIHSLRRKLEKICLDELGREKENFTREDYQRIEKLMLRAAHRIAHPLMLQMKEGGKHPEHPSDPVHVISNAFQLDGEE